MLNAIPTNPRDLAAHIHRFADVAAPAPEVFNMTAAEVTALQSTATTLETDADTRDNARTALRVANETLTHAGSAANALVRPLMRRASASNAPAATKIAAGVPIPKPRTYPQPQVPASLVALPQTDGTNDLKWDRNSNAVGTSFVIEARNGTPAWFVVNVVSATRYKAQAGVGVHMTYRIRARNGQGTSAPSNEAVVYGS